MLREVGDTTMEESVEASNQSDEVEEPILSPTVEIEPSNNSQNQSAMESQPEKQNQPTTDENSRVARDATEGTNEHLAAAPRYPRREHRLPKHYHTDVYTFDFYSICTYNINKLLYSLIVVVLVERSVVHKYCSVMLYEAMHCLYLFVCL